MYFHSLCSHLSTSDYITKEWRHSFPSHLTCKPTPTKHLNCAITRFDMSDGGDVMLSYLNNVSHMEPHPELLPRKMGGGLI